MTTSYPMTTVIARRRFSVSASKGRRSSAFVEIGTPAQQGRQWYCPLELRGFPEPWNRVYRALGVDAVQTLHLALFLAGSLVKSASNGDPRQFSPWNRARNYGFPELQITDEERARVKAALARVDAEERPKGRTPKRRRT